MWFKKQYPKRVWAVIYVADDLKSFCEKWGLELFDPANCSVCQKPRELNRPFLTKKMAGVMITQCCKFERVMVVVSRTGGLPEPFEDIPICD